MGAKGLRWSDVLESAPESWKRVPLGEVFEERKEQNHPDLPLLSVTAEHGVVPRDSLTRRDTSNPDKSRYLRVCPGDIVYNTMRMWQGVSALASEEGIVSPAYTVCTPRPSIDATFASYLLKVQALVNVFRNRSQGLVDDTLSLRFDEFAKIRIPLPPLAEQKRIAEIIGSVDEAIQATRAVIEQTRKVKQGMLYELLTRGIGHTRFKQTEIGELPEGWEVARVGEVADVAYGLTVNAARRKSDRRYPYLTVANIKNDGVHLGTVKDIGVLAGDVERYQLQHEDLLLVEGNGNPDSLGMPALWEDIGQTILHQNHLIRVRVCSDLTLPRWLYTCFQSPRCKRQIRRRAKTSSGLHTINSRVVRDIWVPVPPRMEQLRILGTLDSANGSLSQCTSNLARLDQVKRALVQMLLLQRESS